MLTEAVRWFISCTAKTSYKFCFFMCTCKQVAANTLFSDKLFTVSVKVYLMLALANNNVEMPIRTADVIVTVL